MMIMLYILLGLVGFVSLGLLGTLLVILFTYFFGPIVGIGSTLLLLCLAIILKG